MKRGELFVFEGGDGVGKSTQATYLAMRLRERGDDVHVAAEPTSGPIGMLLRQVATGSRLVTNADAICMLAAAEATVHAVAEIEPRLDRGQTVVLDRYTPVSAVVSRMVADLVFQCGVCSVLYDIRDMKRVSLGILEGRRCCPKCGNTPIYDAPRFSHEATARARWVAGLMPYAPRPSLILVLTPNDEERARRATSMNVAEERAHEVYARFEELHLHRSGWAYRHVDATASVEDVASAVWMAVTAPEPTE